MKRFSSFKACRFGRLMASFICAVFLAPLSSLAEPSPKASQPLSWPELVMAKVNKTKYCPGNSIGEAAVAFEIKKDGGLASVSVVESSGSSAMDRVAVESVRKASPFPPPSPQVVSNLKLVISLRCLGQSKQKMPDRYESDVLAHIAGAFANAHLGKPANKVVVYVRIDDTGGFEKLAIRSSSGDPEYDEKVKAIVQSTAPVRKPPPGGHRDFDFTALDAAKN